MPSTISSLINASLSLQLSSYLNHFRRCLRRVIRSRINIVSEVPARRCAELQEVDHQDIFQYRS
eukprot:8709334-Pyramimonas_sp.AAC.1